jgi:subtilisin family serine protease
MRFSKLSLMAVAVLAAVVHLGDAAAQGRSPLALAALDDPSKSHVPGELLVQYQRGVSESEKDRALARIRAAFAEEIAAGAARFDGGDLELVRLPPGLAIAAAIRGIEADPAVVFAEPNWIYRHTAISNDTYYKNGSLWGMYGDESTPTNQFGSQAAEAWANNNTCSSTVYVGVIDEGVMIGHPDLAANIGTNPARNPGQWHRRRRQWLRRRRPRLGFRRQQQHRVRRHAGRPWIARGRHHRCGGRQRRWRGRCLLERQDPDREVPRPCNGGTTANAIKSVDYMTDLKNRHGIRLVATNNSWGGGGYSKALYDAIERANAANILFIAAAGNSGVNNNTTPHYPSSYTNGNIIAVASITSTGALSSFSNYGSTSVHLGAPGSGIWSTVPGRKGASYASYSGTSMATPHVTGAAAMYASSNPGATAAQIKAAILGAVVPTTSLSGKTTTGGRLNVSGF